MYQSVSDDLPNVDLEWRLSENDPGQEFLHGITFSIDPTVCATTIGADSGVCELNEATLSRYGAGMASTLQSLFTDRLPATVCKGPWSIHLPRELSDLAE
jgi:hypothetical protein